MSLSCPSFIEEFAPSLCRPVDLYCERTSAAFDAEPVNAITNAAFLIAAIAIWRLVSGARSHHPYSASVKLLALIVFAVGAGSFAFHTVGTKWAEWADVIPILLFMVAYLWIILGALFFWSAWLKLPAVATFFVLTYWLSLESTTALLTPLMPAKLAEGAMYVPTLILMMAMAIATMGRRPGTSRMFLVAGGVFTLSFLARTLDGPLCQILPLGTHFLWHILNATVLYLLCRALVHPIR
ncbi:MAG: hypothetical protein RLZ98_479 [Pseudomonadota bacterium]|jgi:hypothetical protein